ncbi:MAG: hypothetical protein LBR19_03390 [Bifidobacteriaceae bacterium]|jgi:hypothetical protein|nr:hypothetical protein [Bifidobacteriaceae bacterium]
MRSPLTPLKAVPSALLALTLAATLGGLPAVAAAPAAPQEPELPAAAAPAATLPAAGVATAGLDVPPTVPDGPIVQRFWVLILEPNGYTGAPGTLATTTERQRIEALIEEAEKTYDKNSPRDWDFALASTTSVRRVSASEFPVNTAAGEESALCSTVNYDQAAGYFPEVRAKYPAGDYNNFFWEANQHLLVLHQVDGAEECTKEPYPGWSGIASQPTAQNPNAGGRLQILDGTNLGTAWDAKKGAYKDLATELRGVFVHEMGHTLGLTHPGREACVAAPYAPEGTWNESDYSICGLHPTGDEFSAMGINSVDFTATEFYWWGLLNQYQYQVVKQKQSVAGITIYSRSAGNVRQVVVIESPQQDQSYSVEHRFFGNGDARNGAYVIVRQGYVNSLRGPASAYFPGQQVAPLPVGQTYTGAGGAVKITVTASSEDSSTINVITGTQPYVGIGPLTSGDKFSAVAQTVEDLWVYTSASTWKAEVAGSGKDWLSLSATTGVNGAKLELTLAANPNSSGRLGQILISGGDAARSFWVYQQGVDECGADPDPKHPDYCELSVSSSLSGGTYGLQSFSDVDLFRFTAPASGRYRFAASGMTSVTQVGLHVSDSNNKQIGSCWGAFTSTGTATPLECDLVAGQVYFLNAYHGTVTPTVANPYTITVYGPSLITRAWVSSVVISGQPNVGLPLKAVASGVLPVGATLTYQWYRGSSAITTAKSATYTPTASDAGQRLYVIVTASSPGMADGSQSADSVTVPQPGIGGTVRSQNGGSVTGFWMSYNNFGCDGVADNATPAEDWDDIQLPSGGAFTLGRYSNECYKVYFYLTDYIVPVTLNGVTAKSHIVRAGSRNLQFTLVTGITLNTPTVSGTAQVGQTLTASTPTVTPTEAALSYQWYRGTTLIPNAIAKTYTLQPADYNTSVRVRVTAKLAPYTDVSKESTAVTVRAGQAAVGTVTISGQVAVGSTLTATASGVVPTGAGLGYQWYRGSTAITNATSASYTVQAADSGYSLRVRVTATATGYNSGYKDATTATVARASCTVGSVTVGGTKKVGYQLTATANSVNPSNCTLTYRWYRGTTAIGSATTSNTRTVVAADAGQYLKVQVTASLTNYSSTTTESPQYYINYGDITLSTPTLSGTSTVGGTLTSSIPTVSPTATLTYEWYRGSAVVQSGTSRTSRLVAADAGQYIRVRVTAKASGYSDTYRDSTQVFVSQGTISFTSTPTISGTLRVGATLTSSVPGTSPAANLSYQWYRGSALIPGANARTYTTVAADSGQYLKVTVTASLAGYAEVSRSSAQVFIAVAAVAAIGSVTVSGPPLQSYSLTATATGLTPTNATLTYQWYRGSTPISGATARTYAPRAEDAAQYVWVRVTAKATGYIEATKDSAQYRVTGAGTGVSGSLTASDGGSISGWRIYFDNYSCDGLTDIKTPAQDLGYASLTASNQWAAGIYAGECYKISVRTASGGTVASTLGSTTATNHLVRVGVRGVSLRVPTKITVGSVAISGIPAVGYQLSAAAVGMVPANAYLDYEWYRGGVAIPGASAKTYTLVAADGGQAISVRITAWIAGLDEVTKASSAVAVVASGTGVAGTVVSAAGTDVTGYRVAYDNFTCATKTDLTTPTDDYSSVYATGGGGFAAGRYAQECYRIRVYNKSSALLRVTYNGVAATEHFVPAGARGVTLAVP